MGPQPQAPAAERRTAVENVYRALKRDITTLRHRPGAPLAEHQLAGLYGTSRVPVREACRRLQQEGLLTSRPFRGYAVAQISLKDIADCFDLRELLEGHAVELAVRHASADDLERLRGLAATGYTYHDWQSYADFLERNFEFHIELAALSRNGRLVDALRGLLGVMQRFFFLGLDLGDFAAEMRAEHEALVALVLERRQEAAAACLRRQIRSSRDRILRALINGRLDLPLE